MRRAAGGQLRVLAVCRGAFYPYARQRRGRSESGCAAPKGRHRPPLISRLFTFRTSRRADRNDETRSACARHRRHARNAHHRSCDRQSTPDTRPAARPEPDRCAQTYAGRSPTDFIRSLCPLIGSSKDGGTPATPQSIGRDALREQDAKSPSHRTRRSHAHAPVFLIGADSYQQSRAPPGEFQGAPPLKLLRLDAIQTCRFQSRIVPDEAYIQRLAQRIQADRLYHPIMVRPLAGGQYELVTGRCRWEAYKRLKRDVIPAIVHRLNEGQAAHAILYDHLFNKTLSDFELFKGFQQLLELDPTLSLRTLSQEIGWPLWRIKRVMAFGRLPDAAQAVLSTNPDIISAGLAYRLAGQAARGRQGHVVEAIRRIQQGTLLKSRAVKWIYAQIGEKPLSDRRNNNGIGGTACSCSG